MKNDWILWVSTAMASVALVSSGCDGCRTTPDDHDADGMAFVDAGRDEGAEPLDTGAEDVGFRPDGGDDMGRSGVSIEGLSAPATVRFDEHGVLHVRCATDEDCFAVQGYFHARHRFGQMDLNRRVATGRISTLVGNLAVDFDETMRLLLSTRDGEPLADAMWEATSPEGKALISAYTRGVNAWLEDLASGRNGAKLPDEYDFPLLQSDTIFAWTETDSIAAALLIVDALSNRSESDLLEGEIHALLTPDQAFDFLAGPSVTGVTTLGVAGETFGSNVGLQRRPSTEGLAVASARLRTAVPLMRRAAARLRHADEMRGLDRSRAGSNGWLLSGERTASGFPILANDPHLDVSNPNIWYFSELDAATEGEGSHVTGVSLPGFPGVILGHNERVAWGSTTSYWDLSDVYVEELTADGKGVVFDGGVVPIVERDVEFEIPGADPEIRTLRWVPHHGPILAYDPAEGTAISLRWTGNDARTDADAILSLRKAASVEEVRASLEGVTTLNQSWMAADVAGNIAWMPFDDVPRRPWASLETPPWAPLPGDGTAEWEAPYATAELPQTTNPATGVVITANNDHTGATLDGDPTNQTYGYLQKPGESTGYRIGRIAALLDAAPMQTPSDSMEIQYDHYVAARDAIVPPVQTVVQAAATPPSAAVAELLATLGAWDGTCPTGLAGNEPDSAPATDDAELDASAGCVAFHTLFVELGAGVFADELADVDFTTHHLTQPVAQTLSLLMSRPQDLRYGDSWFDDVATPEVETREVTVLAALERAAGTVAELYPDASSPRDWTWGTHHALRLPANLLDSINVMRFNGPEAAAPGGLLSVNVATPDAFSTDDFRFTHAASMRHVVELRPDGLVSHWAMPGGQHHFRDSPHYLDLLPGWLEGVYFEMPFAPEDVDAAAVETADVTPR